MSPSYDGILLRTLCIPLYKGPPLNWSSTTRFNRHPHAAPIRRNIIPDGVYEWFLREQVGQIDGETEVGNGHGVRLDVTSFTICISNCSGARLGMGAKKMNGKGWFYEPMKTQKVGEGFG